MDHFIVEIARNSILQIEVFAKRSKEMPREGDEAYTRRLRRRQQQSTIKARRTIATFFADRGVEP